MEHLAVHLTIFWVHWRKRNGERFHRLLSVAAWLKWPHMSVWSCAPHHYSHPSSWWTFTTERSVPNPLNTNSLHFLTTSSGEYEDRIHSSLPRIIWLSTSFFLLTGTSLHPWSPLGPFEKQFEVLESETMWITLSWHSAVSSTTMSKKIASHKHMMSEATIFPYCP